MDKQNSRLDDTLNGFDARKATPSVPEDFEAQLRRLYAQEDSKGEPDVFSFSTPGAEDAEDDIPTPSARPMAPAGPSSRSPSTPRSADAPRRTPERNASAPRNERMGPRSVPQRREPPRNAPPRPAPPRRRSGPGFLRITGRILAVILSAVLLFAGFLMGVMFVLTHGPSQEAQRLFVLSTNETSALKFLPGWFLSDEKVDAILHPAPVEAAPDTFRELGYESEAGQTAEEPGALVQISEETATDELEILDVKRGTFKGKLMIIHDPARVVVGTLDAYGGYGIYLTDFIEKYGAVAGTNAGGFYDPDGQGTGGIPDGMVMRDGEIVFGSAYNYYNNVIGFDADHILHVGDMSGQQAIDAGIMSAVSFTPGPVLIQDGVKRTGLGGGVNPRTCIGQRADGAVLLAVIEGRHPDSLGATYDDLADLMEEYGAVNAANLDGGSSSAMIYEGEQITKGSSLIGSRRMATAILILP